MSERVREEMVEALAIMLYAADRPSQLSDLAALVGVRFTIADQYQSALRIAAALAARPASAEKTASVVRAWPWPEQRAQLEAMLVRTEAYTTPPAAAQDREFSRCVWCKAEVEWFASDDREVAESKLREHSATCPEHPAVKAINAARAAGATDGK